MKRALFATILGTVVAAVFGAGSALAFDNRQAALALHVAPVRQQAPCTVPGLRSATMNQQTNILSQPGTGPFYYVYLLACNGSDSTGIAGIECGIQYQGEFNPTGNPGQPLVVFGWNSCATLDFQSTGWPAPGGGNAITWNSAACQNVRSEPLVKYSVVAIAGYFYVGAYAPSVMYITPRAVSGRAGVADCAAREDFIDGLIPTHLGSAGFALAGFNPCGAITPVESSSWSTIKGQYGN